MSQDQRLKSCIVLLALMNGTSDPSAKMVYHQQYLRMKRRLK